MEVKRSKMYWVRAMATASYFFNRITTEKSRKSPLELFFGKEPDLRKLPMFGCTVFMQKQKQQRSKQKTRGVKCKFLGYDDCNPSTMIVDVVAETDSGKLHFARKTIFNENEIPSSEFSGDIFVRPEGDYLIDIFENRNEKKEKKTSTNPKIIEVANLRTNAQEEEQSDDVDSLADDQAIFEITNDASKSQVVKEETEENGKR